MFFLTFYFNFSFQIHGAVLLLATFDHLNTGHQKTSKEIIKIYANCSNVGELQYTKSNHVNIRPYGWSRTIH